MISCVLPYVFCHCVATGIQMTDQYKDSYHKFYPQLLESLPMTDSRFRAALVQKRMFPGDLLNQVAAKDTRAEKNEHFLHTEIFTALNIGNTDPFTSLLEVMESFGDQTLKKLAEDMKRYISRNITSNSLMVPSTIGDEC